MTLIAACLRRLPLLALLTATVSVRAEDQPLLRPDASIEIPGATGKFDFLEIDGGRHRLLAAHEKAGTADFFDLQAGKLITRVETGPAVHIAVDDKDGKYFVSASDEKKVVVLDSTTLKITDTIATEGELDAIVYVAKTGKVYVTHDEGSHVWVIDAASDKIVGTIDVPGIPEYMLYDAVTDRLYLNLKSINAIIAIDPSTLAVVSRWSTLPAKSPHGLALDPATGRLFSAGANGVLAAIDIKSGQVIGSAAIAEKVDQNVFDPFTRRIYCACGSVMSVVQETEGGLTALGGVKSEATAKNVAIDPTTHEVWTTWTDGKNSYAKSWRP